MAKYTWIGRERKEDRSAEGLTVLSGNGTRMISAKGKHDMISVHEICSLTGVTRKTLFHYDKIGLLKPAERSGVQNAKLYGEEELRKLLRILDYQKAGLSLREIALILEAAEEEQREILLGVLKRLQKQQEQVQKEMDLTKQLLQEIVLPDTE